MRRLLAGISAPPIGLSFAGGGTAIHCARAGRAGAAAWRRSSTLARMREVRSGGVWLPSTSSRQASIRGSSPCDSDCGRPRSTHSSGRADERSRAARHASSSVSCATRPKRGSFRRARCDTRKNELCDVSASPSKALLARMRSTHDCPGSKTSHCFPVCSSSHRSSSRAELAS